MAIHFDGIYLGSGETPFILYWYGVVLMSGAFFGGWLAAQRAEKRGHNPDLVWDLLVWLIIAGVAGARLWHVFTPAPSAIAAGLTTWHYLTHPLDLINLRMGGLGIPGAVIGGAIAAYFFTRKRGLNFAEWADIAAPALALGQAVGRWGNYFNQELYGAPTDLPWKIFIEPAKRLTGHLDQEYYHPLFLYESLWNFANLFLLLWLDRRFGKKLPHGSLFLIYLIVYPLGRFLFDFLRLDASMLGGINANQTFMAIVALLAAGALLWQLLRSRKTDQPKNR